MTPDVEARLAALRERADLARLPPEFRCDSDAVDSRRAATFAALIGIRLPGLLRGATPRPTSVVTDTRNHWASRWIAPVLRAGIMEPYPNHTFQPRDEIRRLDLAVAASRVLDLIAAHEPTAPSRWSETSVALVDLAPTHPAYKDVSRAVAAWRARRAEPLLRSDRGWSQVAEAQDRREPARAPGGHSARGARSAAITHGRSDAGQSAHAAADAADSRVRHPDCLWRDGMGVARVPRRGHH
jgi:hypothetical protein